MSARGLRRAARALAMVGLWLAGACAHGGAAGPARGEAANAAESGGEGRDRDADDREGRDRDTDDRQGRDRDTTAARTATTTPAPRTDAPTTPPPRSDAPAPLPEGEGEAEPAPPRPALPTPATVLILGDSKIATDFGAALQRELAAHPALRVVRRGKSATGLSRPDFFDWTREATRLIAEHRPDVIVVGLGGNDGQDLPATARGTRRVEWGSGPWPEAYGARVRAFVELLAGEARQVVWLEVTTADRPRLEAKLETIRAVQRAAVEGFGPRAHYLPTQHHLRDARGGILRQIEVRGRSYPLRIDDGIHFSALGGGWLARRVRAELLARLGLEGGDEHLGIDDEARAR